MQELTVFQRETERLLEERLMTLGVSLEGRAVSGQEEIFVEATVKDIRIWIYLDEACVIGRAVDRVFEKWDYSSPDELRQAFVNCVISLLGG